MAESTPEPPFDSGDPKTASPEDVAAARAVMSELLEERRALIDRLTK